MGATADLVKTLLDAWNRRDMDAVAQHLHSDFEWVEHDENPTQGPPFTGKSAVERVTEDLDDGFADYRAEVVEVVEIDDTTAVAVTRETGRGSTSGAPFSTEFGYVVTVRDGKAARVEAHRDPRDAFVAAGHSVEGSGA